MRIWVERYSNMQGSRPGRRIPGYSHFFDDYTDRPMPCVMSRPLFMVCVPEPGDPGFEERPAWAQP